MNVVTYHYFAYLPTHPPLQRTYKITQSTLAESLDEQTARQIYNLNLTASAPYTVNYSRTGRQLLLAGRTGHVAILDALTRNLTMELQLTSPPNSIRAATFLHNSSLFALAEKSRVFIYDDKGAEVHMLHDHQEPLALQYLPYHWLLASVGRTGYLKYTDTSTGTKVCEIRTKLGACGVMQANPYNSCMHLGHGTGVVTMYSPAVSTPLVKMLCHKGPITAMAIDLTGKYMVTAGSDKQVKVWDIRTYKEVHSYYSHHAVTDLDLSQTDMLCVGGAGNVNVWKDALRVKQQSPYMSERIGQGGCSVQSVKFRPFEDVLGVGSSEGFSSLVIPGSGEAGVDTYESNMFQDKKQRQESEVRSLLDKISPDLIGLDPNALGQVERDRKVVVKEQRELQTEARDRRKEEDKGKKVAKKARGRNKINKKLARKHKNIVDEGKIKLEEKKRDAKEAQGDFETGVSVEEKKRRKGVEDGGALARFF